MLLHQQQTDKLECSAPNTSNRCYTSNRL